MPGLKKPFITSSFLVSILVISNIGTLVLFGKACQQALEEAKELVDNMAEDTVRF